MTPGCKRLVVNSKMNECIEISRRTHRLTLEDNRSAPWEEPRPWGGRKNVTFVIDPLVLSKFVMCVSDFFEEKHSSKTFNPSQAPGEKEFATERFADNLCCVRTYRTALEKEGMMNEFTQNSQNQNT